MACQTEAVVPDVENAKPNRKMLKTFFRYSDEKMQNSTLMAFYVGYPILQVLFGGYLSRRFGGKKVQLCFISFPHGMITWHSDYAELQKNCSKTGQYNSIAF